MNAYKRVLDEVIEVGGLFGDFISEVLAILIGEEFQGCLSVKTIPITDAPEHDGEQISFFVRRHSWKLVEPHFDALLVFSLTFASDFFCFGFFAPFRGHADARICVHLRFSRPRLLGIHSRLALLLPDFMTGKGISSLFYRSTLTALVALATLTVFMVFALTLRGQNAPGTATPSTTPSPSPSPKTKASPAPTRPAPPPKPYATAYGKPWPSPSPSPSVQLAPDLIPDLQHVPVPTPPPPATNDLLPENKPLPTPVGPQPSEPDLLPSTPTPGPSPAGSASTAAASPQETPTRKKLAEEVLKQKMRFRQVESAAERDPHAIEMWNTANKQYTMEYRREWQRLYYVYVCNIMRKLDPSLSELIDNWEQTHLSGQSLHNSRPTVPQDELRGPAESQTR